MHKIVLKTDSFIYVLKREKCNKTELLKNLKQLLRTYRQLSLMHLLP